MLFDSGIQDLPIVFRDAREGCIRLRILRLRALGGMFIRRIRGRRIRLSSQNLREHVAKLLDFQTRLLQLALHLFDRVGQGRNL